MQTRTKQLWLGALETLPLVVAAFPFGIVFGAMAHANGLSFAVSVGMSSLVFAGASQFIAVTLIASAAIPHASRRALATAAARIASVLPDG
jgi:predicted branched-subunit amino acid permease